MSGLQTLQSRRTQAKTLTFYKIYKDISPAYLKELVPKEVGEQTHRNLRNTQDIRPPKTSKNYFLKSYIPSSIRLWNKLPHNIRSIAKLDTFRINLHKIYCKPQTYKPYLTGYTPGHTHLSRFVWTSVVSMPIGRNSTLLTTAPAQIATHPKKTLNTSSHTVMPIPPLDVYCLTTSAYSSQTLPST